MRGPREGRKGALEGALDDVDEAGADEGGREDVLFDNPHARALLLLLPTPVPVPGSGVPAGGLLEERPPLGEGGAVALADGAVVAADEDGGLDGLGPAGAGAQGAEGLGAEGVPVADGAEEVAQVDEVEGGGGEGPLGIATTAGVSDLLVREGGKGGRRGGLV